MTNDPEATYENDEEVALTLGALKAVYNECITRAGMEKHSNDGIDYLKEARHLKEHLDAIRIDQFQKNSPLFAQLRQNYSVVIQNEKERVQKLKNLVDTLSTLVDFATILDDAAKIAAGLAQSA